MAANEEKTGGKAAKGDNKNKIPLTVVVSGTPVTIDANVNAPLSALVEQALGKSGTVGQDLGRWELKTEDGRTFDFALKIIEAGLVAGMTLFLSPKAGAAG